MTSTTFQTINPATEEVLATFSYHTETQIEQTISRSHKASLHLRKMKTEERAMNLIRFGAALREKKSVLAESISLEMGKVLREAEAEVEKCAKTAVWFGENGLRWLADETAAVHEAESYVSYLPLGPILSIMPWNFPVWQVCRFTLPSLLTGNTALIKHAPNVMGTATTLEGVFAEAGFAEGAFQNLVIPVEKVGSVISDARIAGVSLTGSGKAGAAVAAQAGQALKKCLLELGGSDAFIVLEDADIDAAVAAGIKSRYANAGQVCLAAKRFILVEKIADEFERKFTEAAAALTVGSPFDPKVSMGPLARRDLLEKLDQQVRQSIKGGAQLLTGGQVEKEKGYFYKPTVLSHVAPGMPAFDEESFGPVASLMRVPDSAAAVALANHSTYGLSSNLWTRNKTVAKALARQIEAGAVFINSFSASDPRVPVGGVKQSGFGRELSHFGLREFANAQTVWIGG